MIRLLFTAALVGGLLRQVFGQDTRRRKAAPSRPGAKKSARRASRRARQATA